MKLLLTVLLVVSLTPLICAADTNLTARQLAESVWTSSGGPEWPKVKELRFTFNVSQGTKLLLSAAHDWNVWTGMDTVRWAGKTVTINVWGDNREGDAKAAYQRWTNDSYWLLAPLKLLDKGVHLDYRGLEKIDQHPYQVLHLSFGEVGLTMHDQYNLYIDPQTHLLQRWDYMPTPEKKMTGTWDKYREIGGLRLATDHVMGDKRIWFSDLSAETDAGH